MIQNKEAGRLTCIESSKYIWNSYGNIYNVVNLFAYFYWLFAFFISKVLLTMICFGFATITPLIDFNESHATNPLWTGHARFHLVWQVNAMILTAILSLFLLWAYDSFFNLVLVIILNYLWIVSFHNFCINKIIWRRV